MHILIYIHSVFNDHYEILFPFESGRKTAWSQVNCQTQTQVLIINAILHTAALNHGANLPLPSLVLFKVIWSQFVIKRPADTAQRVSVIGFCLLFSIFSPFLVPFSLVTVPKIVSNKHCMSPLTRTNSRKKNIFLNIYQIALVKNEERGWCWGSVPELG